ncbi:hypothetical protein L195_g012042 [Trifolium pratense]|uniref:Copia protein n=2 Tax=Trifolium pratense TaxID=57577 RepID=A0A2K3LUD9_TRIPR|nr:hypothetical protein L195_g038180 [Trifolium pratense]PNY15348.1 hypothetical protein L195_g012042 [Trifolium pratense]
MSAAHSEIIWLCGLLAELGFPQTKPTSLYADSISAIQIVANPFFHERTRHIEVDCQSIRGTYDDRLIALPHVSTQFQVADLLIKKAEGRGALIAARKIMAQSPIVGVPPNFMT